ncbi:uncharacterized protein LOC143903638 [Temnothorax americanus]|uniref:uncharacterized protein LOC143903638 n=1 Tax=Temnothorax americanus TaxID=1964332 RepID=UPI00406786BF
MRAVDIYDAAIEIALRVSRGVACVYVHTYVYVSCDVTAGIGCARELMPRRSLRRKEYPKSHTNILYSTMWYTILPLYIGCREVIPKRSLRRKVYPKLHMGLVSYAKQLILLRFIGHMKFAHVKLDILKITMHSENDTVQMVRRLFYVNAEWKSL